MGTLDLVEAISLLQSMVRVASESICMWVKSLKDVKCVRVSCVLVSGGLFRSLYWIVGVGASCTSHISFRTIININPKTVLMILSINATEVLVNMTMMLYLPAIVKVNGATNNSDLHLCSQTPM